jgi:hypothetical protein
MARTGRIRVDEQELRASTFLPKGETIRSMIEHGRA